MSTVEQVATSTTRLALTGASGLIGSQLAPTLVEAGWHVHVLVRRRRPRPGTLEIYWNPDENELDTRSLEGVDTVVHLAGESIAGRWTESRKAAIRESRVRGTTLLAKALAQLRRTPRLLVSASAIGYYGERGDEVLTEDSAPGAGFLPEVCQAWEGATQPAREAGVRVITPRIGMVLSRTGGALRQMLRPFRLGLGGRIGSGEQYVSWISLTDVLRVLALFVGAGGAELSGPVNTVAPQPVRSAEFTETLARVLRRPMLLPAPAGAIRTMLGEMGEALLLSSTRAVPSRLQALGFQFAHPTLEAALRAET